MVIEALLLAPGLFLIALASRNIYLARRSMHWPAAEGTIDDTAVRRVGTDTTIRVSGFEFTEPPRYWQDVLYRYEVNGRYYTGSRKCFGWRKRTSFREEKASAEYYAGTPVVVRYDPADPSRAILEPGVNLSLAVEMVIGVVLAGAGVWAIVAF